MSTIKPQKRFRFVVTSNLAQLLKERGLSQKELARLTGISERAISRIKNRKVVHRIECDAVVRICLALSARPRLKDGRKVPVRLDALFPIKRVR